MIYLSFASITVMFMVYCVLSIFLFSFLFSTCKSTKITDTNPEKAKKQSHHASAVQCHSNCGRWAVGGVAKK